MTTKFITAVGRRKTAVASVRMTTAAKASLMVNGKSPKDYFKTDERTKIAEEALATAQSADHYAVMAHVEGGGIAAQADAVRHAISRAITKAEPNTRKVLKAAHFLKRDPRAKERKKPGLKKARKAPQWSKR
ncbi:30S ribosomal protein S9 [Candidatus Kaiserbacteria bacterium RIFCSPLOWO2_01_FULL_52_12b]|uniref:30S ribosomal protein S9 n=1 Tax=Candidatus Kaiserbacteria bacterium RIFCSPLOWO2_01_FULL_52_12b TaxID=1798509 RepID=A0A1F6EY27_9BACT|nr:MAG: 30S ribosomal protein S9 [Candidatus Kaiserbacteria bacterium RIFCSPLOWO2_01_FULL_52_12b]